MPNRTGRTGTGRPRTVRPRRDTPSRPQRARIEEASPRCEGGDGCARSRPQCPGLGQRAFHVRSDRSQTDAIDLGARGEDHLDPERCPLHHVPPGLLHEPTCPVPTDGPTDIAADHETGPCRAVRPRNVDYQQPSDVPLALPEHRPELGRTSQPSIAAVRAGRCVQGKSPLRKGRRLTRIRLRRDARPALRAAPGEDGTTGPGPHAEAEPVSLLASAVVGLVRPLHGALFDLDRRDARERCALLRERRGEYSGRRARFPGVSPELLVRPCAALAHQLPAQKGRQEPLFALATAETLEL